jgi:hypothetical protein
MRYVGQADTSPRMKEAKLQFIINPDVAVIAASGRKAWLGREVGATVADLAAAVAA